MTPTYNRAYILPVLYESLCNQTNKDFEWIIIDDGSTDNTEELVKQWTESNLPFEIIYKKKKNGGKHTAINDGVLISKYDWFNVVDSDDFLTPNSVEVKIKWISSIEKDDTFAGVWGLRGYIEKNEIIGTYPVEKKYKQFIDIIGLPYYIIKYRLQGDKDAVVRTHLYKQFPFPEYEGENFMSEAVFWLKVGQAGLKSRVINEITRRGEYLQDGLTSAGEKIYIDNFEGYTLAEQINIKNPGLHPYCIHVRRYFRIAKQKGLRFHEARVKLGITVFMAYFVYAAKVVSTPMNILNIYKKNGFKGVLTEAKEKFKHLKNLFM